jgi:hypothetical protein
METACWPGPYAVAPYRSSGHKVPGAGRPAPHKTLCNAPGCQRAWGRRDDGLVPRAELKMADAHPPCQANFAARFTGEGPSRRRPERFFTLRPISGPRFPASSRARSSTVGAALLSGPHGQGLSPAMGRPGAVACGSRVVATQAANTVRKTASPRGLPGTLLIRPRMFH